MTVAGAWGGGGSSEGVTNKECRLGKAALGGRASCRARRLAGLKAEQTRRSPVSWDHCVRGQGQQVLPRQGITTGAGKKCVKNTTSSMGTVGTGSHADTYTCAAAAGVHTP